MRRINTMAISASAIIVLMLSACGGSSTSDGGPTDPDTSVTALKLPGNIDVIKAADESSSSSKSSISLKNGSFKTLQTKYEAPSGSDYESDTAQFWVNDDSTEALTVVNMIMGFIRDTNYAEFVNKGPYIAMIEDNEDNEGNQDSAKGQSSSDSTEQLMEFVLNVQREDNDSPMIIDGWVDDPEQDISFKIEVTEGVSSEYPAGAFVMYIKGVLPDGTVTMRNILEIGSSDDSSLPVSVKYKEAGSDGPSREFTAEANLLATTDFATGKAYTKSNCYNEEINEEGVCEYKIAYNAEYARTDKISFNGTADSDTTGIILDKENYNYKIYNYGLYDKTTGNRPTLNAGKHIKVTVDGEIYHGHAGYWGIWAGKEGLDLSTATIEDDDGINYTVFTASGKLGKHVKLSIFLSELDAVAMNIWDGNGEKIIEWDKEEQKFYEIATKSWNKGVPNITPLATKIELTANTNEGWEGDAWCSDLQSHFDIGSLFKASGQLQAAPTNDTTLKYFKRTTVVPGELSSDLVLVSYSDTKYKGIITKASIEGNTIVEQANFESIDWENDNVDDVFKNTYSFGQETMILNAGESVDTSKSITFASDVQRSDLDGVEYSWGLHVEPLLDNTALSTVIGNIGEITMENWWQVRDNADTFYSWNTGLDDWNKLRTLKKTDGTFVTFDQPWEISYTHTTANDRDDLSTDDGKKFRLTFDGDRLDIPWNYDAVRKTWKPVFALKDEVELTYDSTTYVIKALEGEKLLNKVTAAEVTAAGGVVPDLSAVSLGATGLDLSSVDDITFATKPTTELAVEVIKGISQE